MRELHRAERTGPCPGEIEHPNSCKRKISHSKFL
jgi:hypothetical protein